VVATDRIDAQKKGAEDWYPSYYGEEEFAPQTVVEEEVQTVMLRPIHQQNDSSAGWVRIIPVQSLDQGEQEGTYYSGYRVDEERQYVDGELGYWSRAEWVEAELESRPVTLTQLAINIAPGSQLDKDITVAFPQEIQNYQKQLTALAALEQRTHAQSYDGQETYIVDFVERCIGQERALIERAILRLQWGLKEVEHQEAIQHGPHFCVEYDAKYEDEYDSETARVYLPALLVEHFGSVEAAFEFQTELDRRVIMDQSEDAGYVFDGKSWIELPGDKGAEA